MEIPFDNSSGEKYAFEIFEELADEGDGIVLTLNKKACLGFSKLFAELAEQNNETHIHIGYDEDEPQGPGVRIILKDV